MRPSTANAARDCARASAAAATTLRAQSSAASSGVNTACPQAIWPGWLQLLPTKPSPCATRASCSNPGGSCTARCAPPHAHAPASAAPRTSRPPAARTLPRHRPADLARVYASLADDTLPLRDPCLVFEPGRILEVRMRAIAGEHAGLGRGQRHAEHRRMHIGRIVAADALRLEQVAQAQLQ